jgi:Uma2 family endonuclease
MPEEDRYELIDGELIQKAAPSHEHGRAQARAMAALVGPYDRKPGGPSGPGGWWIGSEIDIALEGRGYRPDVAGWRRDRVERLPKGRPVTIRPDWICEVVSDSNRNVDTIKKLRNFHAAAVPHYWLLDEPDRSLTVYRHSPEGYLLVLAATAGQIVRAEPFDAIELNVSELLGDDV